MKLLTTDEIKSEILQSLNGWSYEQNSLRKEFKLKDFVSAFSFMTAIALEAEKMDHHPDWSNSYGLVTISLTTHSAGGVTSNDISLAKKIESLNKKNDSQH